MKSVAIKRCVCAIAGDASRPASLTLTRPKRKPRTCFAPRKRACYEEFFADDAESIVRQGDQFDNCYIAVMMFDRSGKRLDMAIDDLSDAKNEPSKLKFTPPNGTAKTSVLIFLSKSGQLSLQDLRLAQAKAESPLDQLMSAMQASYRFTNHKHIDWSKLESKYRKSAEAATLPAEFAKAIKPMLSQLNDIHVWIELPDGTTIYPSTSTRAPSDNSESVRSQLTGLKTFGNCGFTGTTTDGIGVVVITSLPINDSFESMVKSIQSLNGVQKWIVDLRNNRGGSEPQAARIAGMFTQTATHYARQQVRRNGKLEETKPRVLKPASPFKDGRLVCLIGPGCVSSGEGMALMMKSIPQVTVIGQPTRGASGNPKPVTLTNGVRVWFSRWIAMEMDGTPIEGRGVRPDEHVEASNNSDATFQRARKILLSNTPN